MATLLNKMKRISPVEIRTGRVRLSFPHIFKPQAKKGNDGNVVLDEHGQSIMQYSTALIIPKTETETVAGIQESMKASALDFFGAGKVPPKWASGFRDGDTDDSALLDPMDPSKGRKPELVGCYFLNATTRVKPTIIGNLKDEFAGGWVLLDETGIKAGDWVRVQLRCYGFDVGTNKGVAFSFSGIQLFEVGEALSTGGFKADAFDDEELEEAFS